MDTYKSFRLTIVVILVALALLLIGVPAARADPRVIYVDKDAPGTTHDGLSWTTAYTNVQDALAVAVYGDEIWVAEGVYYPDEGAGQTNNACGSTFTLIPGVALYGGFNGNETLLLRDWIAYPTVLSGDIDGNDTVDPNGVVASATHISGDNAYHVLYLNGAAPHPITETTVLDGFIITAGNATVSPHTYGGGLYCNGDNGECSPLLTNIIFSGNSATNGGGMFSAGRSGVSKPILTNVTFGGNAATNNGGGMGTISVSSSGESSPTLINVTFSTNSARNGGGMSNSGITSGLSSSTLTNVTFSGNSAQYGGGMYNQGLSGGVSRPVMTNVTFSGNSAYYGGGMYNIGGMSGGTSSPALTNVTFSGNLASYDGGGMWNGVESGGVGNSTLVNCILWGNNAGNGYQLYNSGATPVLNYTLIQSGTRHIAGSSTVTYGPGILTSDPQFIAPIAASYAPTSTGNYRLDFGSPAIDAGDNLSAIVSTDLDGNPRIVGGTVDMGAYEAIPDLALSKSVTPTIDVLYHSVVTYTIILSNTGVGHDTNVILTDTLPTDIAFRQWIEQPPSGLVHSGDAFTWTGSVAASTSVTFTFTATRTGSLSGDIVNTAYFSGTLQKGQATATFTTGSTMCHVEEGHRYTFNNQSGVIIEITTLGDELDCLYVDEIDTDHPSATGESGSSGIKTESYWQIRGLQDDRVSDAIGFTVVLTLPHTELSDPKVCRYTDGAGYGWDCAADGFDGSTVWRSGITSFSEWAVGQHVGPTSLTLRQFAAHGGLRGGALLPAFGLAALIPTFIYAVRRRRARCAMGRQARW